MKDLWQGRACRPRGLPALRYFCTSFLCGVRRRERELQRNVRASSGVHTKIPLTLLSPGLAPHTNVTRLWSDRRTKRRFIMTLLRMQPSDPQK